MNNFSIIGRFLGFSYICNNKICIKLNINSPLRKNMEIEVETTYDKNIEKLNYNDILGIKGYIEKNESNVSLFCTKIVWLPKKYNK